MVFQCISKLLILYVLNSHPCIYTVSSLDVAINVLVSQTKFRIARQLSLGLLMRHINYSVILPKPHEFIDQTVLTVLVDTRLQCVDR